MKGKVLYIILILLGILCIVNISNKLSYAATNEKTIEDGKYEIVTALNENLCLDVAGGYTYNEANVQLYTYMGLKSQQFNVKYLGDGYYSITAVHSGKMLDVAGAGKTNETNVQQYQSNNHDAQKWIIKDAGNGYYNIISKWNGLYLDVKEAKASNENNIQMYQNNGNNAQKFKFKKVDDNITKTIEDGKYEIVTALNENLCLDVAGGYTYNEANVQLYTYMGLKSQQFNVKYLGDGYYSITAVHSGKMLDVAGAGKTNETNVQQYQSNNHDAQKWIIKDAGNGYYNIISKWNGLYLDVKEAKASNGTNIQMYQNNGNNSQKFKFKKIEDISENGKKTIEDGRYKIVTALDENLCLDVAGGYKYNEANVQLYTYMDLRSQRFDVKYIGDGYYTIVAVHSKKVLEVASSGKNQGINVQQYTLNGSLGQKWIIKDVGDGYYNIISSSNGLYMDINSNLAKNEANIEVNVADNTNAQKFKFETAFDINIDTSKYPGYKEKIEKLMEKHPAWNFELLYTGLSLDEVVSGEAKVHSRNLVPSDKSGEWICSVCGTKPYDSGWYCASEKATAYYMDPRNFLDEINIFQFQDVNEYIPGVCTLEGIQNQVNNTYLRNYANDIDTACRNQNVNPYYIISRLIQEQGKNGTQIGRGMDGGDGNTYYNPFNIGASGNGWDEIYANALATAKSYGWNTMEKALEGGITFCKANWLENYQNTLYQNKFDIDTRNGTALYVHQYMQNLMGAYSEAQLLQGMYANTDRLESNFTFIIPVYENMSSTVSQLPSNSSEIYPMDVETTGTKINVRAEANTSSRVLTVIVDKGTKLLSVERGINSNWQKVILTDGTIGYVSGTYLKQIDDQVNCNEKAKVKTNDGYGCNTRLGPSLSIQKGPYLDEATEVTIINKGTYNNIDGFDWYRIKLSDGRQAFIPSRYLQVIQ